MIRRNISVYYLLIIEAIFGSLILSYSYSLQQKEVPLQAYFILILISCFAFAFLLDRFKEKGKWLFFLIILPLLLIAGHVLFSSLIFSLILSLLLYWRTIANFYEQDKSNEGKWLVATILLGILFLFFSTAKAELIILLMICQITFIFIGRFVNQWFQLDSLVNEKSRFFIPFMFIVFFIGGTGLLFTAGINVFKWLFFSVIKMVVFILSFILKPFFNWAEMQDWTIKIEELINIQGGVEFDDSTLNIEKTESIFSVDPAQIITLLLIVCIVFLFVYVFKRKKSALRLSNIHKDSGFSSESSYDLETPRLFALNKSTPPSDQIRKEIYGFERFARKYDIGREPFESLSDWMERIGISNYELINSIYEKVRYGESIYSEKEAKEFKNDLEIKKREIKAMHKK